MYPEVEKTCIGSWKQNKTTQCANGQNKPTGKERSPLSVFQLCARAHRAPSCTSSLEGKEKQMCNAPWSLTRLHGSTQMADLCIRAEHKGLANTSASFDASQCISMQLWQLHSICHGVMLSTMEELLFQASSSWSCEMNRNPCGAAFVPVKGLLVIFVWAAPHLHLFAPSFPLAPLGERVAIVLVPHALESNRKHELATWLAVTRMMPRKTLYLANYTSLLSSSDSLDSFTSKFRKSGSKKSLMSTGPLSANLAKRSAHSCWASDGKTVLRQTLLPTSHLEVRCL